MPVCQRCGEDNPERARFCRPAAPLTALTIREAIAEINQADPTLDLHVRIGVSSGEALVVLDARPVEGEGNGLGGCGQHRRPPAGGRPVEGILVDEATHRATDRQIDYRPAEPVTAKGKADAVPVWVAVAPKASLGVEVDQAGRAALVGREREVQLLRAALDRVREKQSAQLVTLVGVPGIGKSRLVWELKELVEAEAELTLWRQGRCRDAPEMLLPALAFHAHVLLAIALRGLGRAGEQLLEAGRRAGCNAQLQRALAFYRQVRATAYLREGEAVLAASA